MIAQSLTALAFHWEPEFFKDFYLKITIWSLGLVGLPCVAIFMLRVNFSVRRWWRRVQGLPPMVCPCRFDRISRVGYDSEPSWFPLTAALHRYGALHDAALPAVSAARAGADPQAEREDSQQEDGQKWHGDDSAQGILASATA